MWMIVASSCSIGNRHMLDRENIQAGEEAKALKAEQCSPRSIHTHTHIHGYTHKHTKGGRERETRTYIHTTGDFVQLQQRFAMGIDKKLT